MIFKDVLKQLRTERGITQEELAHYLNVTRPTIAGYETKSKEPDYKTLILISKYFNVSIDYLLTGESFENHEHILENNIDSSKKKLINEILKQCDELSDSELEKLLDYENLLILRKNSL